MPSRDYMEANDMNTMTRLWTVLILSILALTLNVLAVVEDLYVLPEDKAADTAMATRNITLTSLPSY